MLLIFIFNVLVDQNDENKVLFHLDITCIQYNL
jgi:hypothetical protein